MRGKRRGKCTKLNNAGSAIVTVIVVIAFITILATTILYVAGMNYYMKLTDIHVKQSFYEAETAMEEIEAALVKEVSDASTTAYQYVMQNHAGMDESALEATFQQQFFTALQTNWDAKTRAESGLGAADTLLAEHYLKLIEKNVDAKYYTGSNTLTLTSGAAVPGSIVWETTDGNHNNYATIYGVRLQYTSAEGYTSIIQTDYVIIMPDINWTMDSSAVTGDTIDMSECVQYANWVKE